MVRLSPTLVIPSLPESQHGYSCQTLLSRKVNEFLHPGFYHCWFARSFNAFGNGDDSNPAILYLTIDRAVKQNASNHSKIKDIRANLLFAVIAELGSTGDVDGISGLIGDINAAPMAAYTPELWRIKLKTVLTRADAGTYRDEYLVRDLREVEFETIVPSVRS